EVREEDSLMSSNPLRDLNSLGQSVWFDYIRRLELTSGHLKELVDVDGVSGVTSNPSIFEKAIAHSNDYDEAIRKLVEEGKETPDIFESLEVEDIRTAADIFRPVYDSTDGRMATSASKWRPPWRVTHRARLW